MIYEKIGNILEQTDASYICHQVNCKGVMGAGLARQIKPLLTQEQFGQYQTVCAKYGAGCLGKIQLFPLQDKILWLFVIILAYYGGQMYEN